MINAQIAVSNLKNTANGSTAIIPEKISSEIPACLITKYNVVSSPINVTHPTIFGFF
jgi:hypothetical protein